MNTSAQSVTVKCATTWAANAHATTTHGATPSTRLNGYGEQATSWRIGHYKNTLQGNLSLLPKRGKRCGVNDDILTRLWQYTPEALNTPMETRLLLNDAADEIERLRDSVAEVDKLRQRISELEDRVSDLEQSRG
jgi:hypothetical protein